MTSTALAWRLALVFSLALLAAGPAVRAQEAVSIAEARAQGVGATVTIEGTVTRAFGSFVRLQDASGPTGASALVIRQTASDNGTRPFRQDLLDRTIAAGTQLRVTGTLSAFNGLLQINGGDLTSYTVQGQGDVPAPQTITVQDLVENGSDYESELVRLPGLRFSGRPGDVFEAGTSYPVTDGTASGTLRVQNADETALIGAPIPAEAFTYTGVTGVFFPNYFDAPSYQLIPVRPGDLTPSAAVQIIGRPYALAYEDEGAPSATLTLRASGLASDATVTLSLRAGSPATADDVQDFDGTRQLTFSGPDPSSQTVTFTAAGDGAAEGVEPLELTLSTDAESVSAAGTFTLWILDDPAAQTTLYPDLEGQALRAQLRADFASEADGVVGPPTLGYDVARDTLYSVVFNDSGLVRGYYTGYEATLDGGDPSQDVDDEDVNAEHVWPQSRGAENEPARSNMHILVPTWAAANGARCNYPYAEINDDETERWFGARGGMGEVLDAPPAPAGRDAYSESVGDDCPPSADGRFEPREVVKGDVARKALYFAMAYPTRIDGSFLNQQKNVLRRWNAQDPVDADEQRRNVLVASYQGHALNPFQLDSTLARRAFFSEEGGGGEVLPITEARGQLSGTTVTVEGVFTRIEGQNARIQDASGPGGASGLVVRDGALADAIASAAVAPGDRLRVTGSLGTFNGLRQISSDVTFDVIEEDAGWPAAQDVSVAVLATGGEAYESELVRVTGLTIAPDGGDEDEDPDSTFKAGGSEGNYVAAGPDGSEITLRIPGGSFYDGRPIPAEAVTFEGVLGQFGADAPANGYQLLAIDAGDLPLPEGTLPVNITRPFGDPDASTSYRLVALPGDAARPLAGTLDGQAGTDWQAYWDDGSDEDFFVQWTDTDTFTFQPGRGFWLLAETPWTVQDAIPAVEREADGTYAVPLDHEGWNIISNPLTDSLAWSAVEAANGGALQPLWRFDGAYAQAGIFASAAKGEAFYFLNNSGLSELVLPAPGASAALAQRAAQEMKQTITLSTYQDGRRTSTAHVGFAPGAAAGLDPHDAFAPPGRFEAASLRLPVPGGEASERAQWLAREVRALGADGYAFDLVLRAAPDTSVTLRASGLQAFAEDEVHLQDATGTVHDLRAEASVQIIPDHETTRLRLLIGSAAYAGEGPDLPDDVTLQPGYPNPFREKTTLQYALPQASDVRLIVYDLLGRRVRVLADGDRQAAGPHTVPWDGRGTAGRPVTSGVYFVRLEAGGAVRTQKLVRIR